MKFLGTKAQQAPIGYGMFLLALLDDETPPAKVTVVLGEQESIGTLTVKIPPDAVVTFLHKPTEQYQRKEGKTTFYVCKSYSCLPPVNDLGEVMDKNFRGDL